LTERFNRVVLTWWFGHAALLLGAIAVVTAAAFLVPSTTMLRIFDVDVPVVCTFRRLTGHNCPGCGLTRSFTFMAHGNVAMAFQMNMLGPLAFCVTLAQVPWRAYKLLSLRHLGFWDRE